MSTLRLAGTLWIMAGVVCAGLLSFVLIGEHINDLGALLANLALPARVLGGALVAFLIGGLLLTRPGPNVVRWSSLAGIAWLIAFGPLVVTSIAAALGGYEFGPVVSSSLITGLGVAGAVVGHLSRSAPVEELGRRSNAVAVRSDPQNPLENPDPSRHQHP